MSLRSLGVVSLSLFALTACPPVVTKPDAHDIDFDAGNPPPRDACSGGCASNQVCDTARRLCVDACGGCDAGTCVKISEGVFQCRTQAVTCGGQTCDVGQIACLGGECSCLSSLSGALDTCQAAGKWCNGHQCQAPKALQQCKPGESSALCPTGHVCLPTVFGDDVATCVKTCANNNECQRGDFCAGLDDTTNGCLPSTFFSNQDCSQHRSAADGGFERDDAGVPLLKVVPVSNTCLLKNSNGVVTDPSAPGKGSGNCTYVIFQLWNDGVYPIETCRPPGNATEGQPCRDDFSATAIATTCGTGLYCAKTKGGDEGVCLRACNAQPASLGFPPQPECNTDEACVNTLRYTDPNSNAVLGVCMKKCSAFETGKNTCANVGTTPASCVPTEPSGEGAVSLTGEGICVPQRPTIADVGANCAETDPFRGAACASGQVCTSLSADERASCVAVCDLDCNPNDGGTGPTRCATSPNAHCATGKSCKQITSTSGAHVGFCL